MTYHELVEKVRTALVVKADASKIQEHIAVQVNVTGEAEGAFYIEIKDGVLCVEPFTYNDRDFQLTGDGADVLAVAQGKKTLESAITEGVLTHEGDWDKTVALGSVIPVAKKSTKKTAKPETPEEGQIALVEEPAPAPAKEETAEKPKRTRKTAETKKEDTKAESAKKTTSKKPRSSGRTKKS